MVTIRELKPAEALKEHEKGAQKGAWKELIAKVKSENKSFKVEGLKRGQVAALYRSAQNEGLKVKTSYKEGTVVVSPGEKEE